MSKLYLPHISIFPQPHMADPAHVVLWMAGNEITAYNNIIKLSVRNEEIASSGTRFQMVLVRLLAWSIRRHIKKGTA